MGATISAPRGGPATGAVSFAAARALRAGGRRIAMASVYRSLEVLHGLHLVQRVDTGQGEALGMVETRGFVGMIEATDFYRPAHATVFDTVLDLYGRGEPADAITVADELGKRGDLTRVGGQAYLHQLIQVVPTAANAGYYARIVRERAILRRLQLLLVLLLRQQHHHIDVQVPHMLRRDPHRGAGRHGRLLLNDRGLRHRRGGQCHARAQQRCVQQT